jgi:hypothetical protein
MDNNSRTKRTIMVIAKILAVFNLYSLLFGVLVVNFFPTIYLVKIIFKFIPLILSILLITNIIGFIIGVIIKYNEWEVPQDLSGTGNPIGGIRFSSISNMLLAMSPFLALIIIRLLNPF